MNNRDVYRGILRKFAASHAGAPEAIEACLEAGDRDAARGTVHNLKGIAGNIGAEGLQQAVIDLEAALSGENSDSWQPFMSPVRKSLDQVLASIGSLPTDTPESDPESSAPGNNTGGKEDTHELRHSLEEWKHMLEKADFQAVKRFVSIKAQLQTLTTPETMTDLEERLGDYDFEGALNVVDELMGLLPPSEANQHGTQKKPQIMEDLS